MGSEMRTQQFAVGDIVAHKRDFLKSVGWYTNVPKNGRVIAVEPFSGANQLVTVDWCEFTADTPGRILSANLLHAKDKSRELY